MTIRETILASMARAYFVDAYANHCDDCEDDDCSVCSSAGKAGPGEDWMDIAPQTEEWAEELASALAVKIEVRNSIPLENAYRAAAGNPRHRKAPTPADFGHHLVMESLGHGVAWTDDHEPHGLRVPRLEGGCL